MSARLYLMCKKKGIAPKKVAEVGVYFPETSNVLPFIREGVPAMLVEADPMCVDKIRLYFAEQPGVDIYPYAIWEQNGQLALYRTNASTFVGELQAAPAIVNDSYARDESNRFIADARKFSEIDDGMIDLLSIDIEGAEWYVLKHMRSRPVVIAVETHAGEYTNPFLPEIRGWMRENNYVRWFVDNTDTVFVRRDAVPLGWGERYWNTLSGALSLAYHRYLRIRRRAAKAAFGGRRRKG
jgi:FkbM family methyltransferase